MARTLSDDGAAFTAREEGAVDHWYLDATGHWTLGIGHLQIGNEFSDVASRRPDGSFSAGRRLTDAEIWDLFRTDAVRYIEAVDRLVTVELTQRQFDMLVDFAFNWGIGDVGGFPATSILRLVNAGNFAGVARELVEGRGPKTDKYPEGRPYDKGLAGVRNRRIREAEAFKTGGPSPMPRKIYSRAEWRAKAANSRSAAPGMTRGLGVHYLGEGRGPTGGLDDSMAKMREIQAFHMGPARGWADYAYNWACDMYGNLFEGRGSKIRNAANGGGTRHGIDANAGWGSCLYLNGTGGPDLTESAKAAINDLHAAEFPDGEWLGHRDFLSTACPGDQTYRWVHSGQHGVTPAPKPEPEPEQEYDMNYIFDGPPEVGGGIYITDGDRAWGVPNGEFLESFFFTGALKHLGTMKAPAFFDLRHRDGTPRSRQVTAAVEAEGALEVNGVAARSIAEYAEASPTVETGDPGCGDTT